MQQSIFQARLGRGIGRGDKGFKAMPQETHLSWVLNAEAQVRTAL